jgi:hypothetical protein
MAKFGDLETKPEDVHDILIAFLDDNGYDGLWNATGECGCETSELSPGDCLTMQCKPGYKSPCPGGDACPADGDCEFHIGPKKPEVKP